MGRPGTKCSFLMKATEYFRSFLEGLNKVADLVSTSDNPQEQNVDLPPPVEPRVEAGKTEDAAHSIRVQPTLPAQVVPFFIGPILGSIRLRIHIKKWTFEHFVKRKRKKNYC